MIEGEDDADDDDDDIRRLRARPTSARGGGGGGGLQQDQTKGQVLEGARRTRAGRAGQTRAGSHYKEGTRSYSPVPAIHDFAGFPPPLAPLAM